MDYKLFVVVLACVVLGGRGEVTSEGVLGNCGEDYGCMERNFVSGIDAIDREEKVEVVEGFLGLKRVEGGEVQAWAGEDVLQRIVRFIGGREVLFKVPSSLDEARKLIESARSSKLKKFVLPFVVLMVLKKSIEVPIYLAIVGLLAFKGLTAGLIALVLSGATAFKSLLENHSSSKVSYEVVPQFAPTHWSRSGVDYPNFGNSGYHTITQY